MQTMTLPRIHFNAPTVLLFSLLCIVIFILQLDEFCAVPGRGGFAINNATHYLKLFTHVLGHGNLEHLFGNLTFILLLGPILEDRYGSSRMAIMILLTAVITGAANILLSQFPLLGASGIVYMFIILSSIVNIRSGTVPLTFILIAGIFIGQEITDGLNKQDNISQMAHIVGGIMGAIIGFRLKR
jgi:membrane associated rhomboid family serine protease